MAVSQNAKAVNKKKSVSCPVGGRNYGQSGGRHFLFFFIFFLLVGKNCPVLEKNCFCKNEKKSPQSALF